MRCNKLDLADSEAVMRHIAITASQAYIQLQLHTIVLRRASCILSRQEAQLRRSETARLSARLILKSCSYI